MTNLKTTLVLAFLLLLIPTTAMAQDDTVFSVITWKVTMPEDGTQAELNTLLEEFHQKVIVPNEKVISERAMRHRSGGDSRDLVFITEYASWNDIEAAAKRQTELMNTAWKTEDAQKAFFDKFNKYFLMHSDEIYSGIKNLDKK